MKKLLILSLIWLMCMETAYCSTTKSNIYNDKGRRVGYYKTYSSGDKVIKIERYDVKTGRRVERIKVGKWIKLKKNA